MKIEQVKSNLRFGGYYLEAQKIEKLELALNRCIAEMKYSAESGNPVSENRVEFELAKNALE